MSQVVTVRVPEETADAMRRIAQKERRSLSDVGARMIEEWVRQNQFAHIEFRSFNGERHACLKERIQVWQVVMVARDYQMNRDQTAMHLGLTNEQIQAALNYYEAFPDEIDMALSENDAMGYEQVKRLLPNVRVSLISPSLASESK